MGGVLSVLTLDNPERRSQRIATKRRASLVIDLTDHPHRIPCMIVDISPEGFRLRGGFRLRRGEMVEVVPEDDPLAAVRCNVVWIGRPGSKEYGEVGLQTVSLPKVR